MNLHEYVPKSSRLTCNVNSFERGSGSMSSFLNQSAGDGTEEEQRIVTLRPRYLSEILKDSRNAVTGAKYF